MDLSDAKMRQLGQRLLVARMRMLSEHGFYGLLLMHMGFAVGDELDTAWVTRDTITFNPDFMDALSDDELMFVLEHEALHAALGHLSRGRGYEDQERFNLACDIVVNSNILLGNGMDLRSITLRGFGESFHLTPKGDEGHSYTAEEVYAMFPDGKPQSGGKQNGPGPSGASGGPVRNGGNPGSLDDVRARGRGQGWDWHVPTGGEDAKADQEAWAQRLRDAREAMRARDPSGERGLVPLCVERMLGELDEAKVDWRALLNDFVQEEVCDYSFCMPDRRLAEGPFLLPSFSDVEATVHNVAFMVDTSASVTDDELNAAFSEMKGALEQFGRKLDGWVGFFDAVAYEPVRFETVEELVAIRPQGGGGTRFEAVFEGVEKHLAFEDVTCVVILSDGCAPFPKEDMAKGVPVLWLLTSAKADPPWGRVARL